jgi:diguanylate cyclase (GGDEF)-like protein
VTPSPATILVLLASVILAVAALATLRCAVAEARGEQLFDGALLGLATATAGAGFGVLPALDGPTAPLATAGLLVVGGGVLGTAFATRAAGARPAVLRVALAYGLLLAGEAAGGTLRSVAVGLCLVAVLDAARSLPRHHRRADPDDAEAPVQRNLVAPVAYLTVFPASLALLLALEGPSTLAIGVWGATWSIAGALAFARQNWILADRHRAIARERDLRREMVRRNAELAALTDLADAVTRMRGERPLVERALQVLLRVSDARSVHIELAGDRHTLPPGATLPDGDPHAVGIPLVVRDEQLGSVLLVGREEPFAQETMRLVGVLGDQLAVGLSHLRDYTEKSHQALRDPLTGIYNRRVLQDALTRELLRARREDGLLALTMLDIDDFKSINDGHGHDAGDEVLRRVAACGREVVRPGDTFARVGGEEFALLTPGAGAQEALLVAERLRLAVAALDVLPDRGVTVSAGLAAWPADAADGDALRRAADEALYRAKAAGKNRCELAGEAPAPA